MVITATIMKYFFFLISSGLIEHVAPGFLIFKNTAKPMNNEPRIIKNGLYLVKLKANDILPRPKKTMTKGVMQQSDAIKAPVIPIPKALFVFSSFLTFLVIFQHPYLLNHIMRC